MILEFSIKNTFSIKEKQTISFEPSKDEDDIHIIKYGDKRFLKMACIYGANAAGKTNIVKSFLFYMDFLLSSFSRLAQEETTYFVPFMFDDKNQNEPGEFNLIFYAENFEDKNLIVKYEYNLVLSRKNVISESLTYSPKGQKKLIFEREKQDIKWGNFQNGSKNVIAEITRPNCSVISAAAQTNHPIFSFIYKHLKNKMMPKVMDTDKGMYDDMLEIIENNEDFKNKVIELLKSSDFGSISDIKIESQEIPDFIIAQMPLDVRQQIFKTGIKPKNRHAIFIHHYNDKDYELPLELESEGTRKMMALSLPLVFLSKSSFLVIDEIEASLHTILVETFIQLHLEISTDSQIIFTTHNTDLLDSGFLRDDEVWFAYKDEKGASSYNSIVEFSGIRKGTSRKKLYEAGKFGGLPIVNMQSLREVFSFEKN